MAESSVSESEPLQHSSCSGGDPLRSTPLLVSSLLSSSFPHGACFGNGPTGRGTAGRRSRSQHRHRHGDRQPFFRRTPGTHVFHGQLLGNVNTRRVRSENNQDQGRHDMFQPLIPNVSSRHNDPTQQDRKDTKDRHNDKYEQQGTVEGETILSIGIADGYNPVSMTQQAQDNKTTT